MSLNFAISQPSIQGLIRVRRHSFNDERGSFDRLFCLETFSGLGLDLTVRQINHSVTAHKGTVRGIHFQRPPSHESKLVTCLQGEILDVAVDLRNGSPTFLQWHAELLSAENEISLYIPEGFAHGFQSLKEDCHLLYLHSDVYSPGLEGALNPLDPALGIEWPLEVTGISARDRDQALLDSSFSGVDVP